MTGRGIACLTAFLLLLFMGLATGIREIYLVVFCVGLLLFLAFLSVLLSAGFLHGCSSFSVAAATRGDSVRYQLAMDGFVLLPVLLQLQVKAPGDDRARDFAFSLPPGTRRKQFAVSLACPHRGVWPAGLTRLRFTDVLGLFSLPPFDKTPLAAADAFTVYPLLYELEGEAAAAAISREYSEANLITADHGDSFAGTRLYRDGDSLKRIHWKQSIRTRVLQTRQYEISTEQYTLLVMDTGSPTAAGLTGYADMATECAAALAYYYAEHSVPVRLLCLGGEEEADWSSAGMEDFTGLYTALAAVPFSLQGAVLDLSALSIANLGLVRAVYVITYRPSAELLDVLHTFTTQHCAAACISPLPFGTAAPAADDSVRRITLSQPEDIPAKLGDCL